MVADPTLIPVMTPSTIDAIEGSEDVMIHLPADGDCGVNGVVIFSPTFTVRVSKAPSVGKSPITVTSK